MRNTAQIETTSSMEVEVRQAIYHLKEQLNSEILGKTALINHLLITLLCNGHLIVEGAPGLAKTKAIKALANKIEASFHRIQFTPDLLRGDLTGTEIYRPETGAFVFQEGPLFNQIILVDEINRAPAKVQSALLEVMAEHQITIGKKTYLLPKLFLVMATPNPLEQEGTYPLPEAQLDRFLMFVRVDYPDSETELGVLRLAQQEFTREPCFVDAFHRVSMNVLKEARKAIQKIHMSPLVERYLVSLITATRNPTPYNPQLASWIRFGQVLEGVLAFLSCSFRLCVASGRDFVVPQDIYAVIFEVLRHRLILSFSAEAEGITAGAIIAELLKSVPAP